MLRVISPRLFDHNLEDGSGITREELNTMIKDYYMERGWNAKGVPPEK